MLSQLKIQNIAIIDNLIIDFNEGFTVLTGETGAGKSLLIEAINLLFGERTSSHIIKTGKIKAIVEGTFKRINESTKNILNALQIQILDDDTVVIKREISNNGKNFIKVNGEIVTLSQLENIAVTLGNIHTQSDTHKLFTKINYLKFLDDDGVKKVLQEYSIIRKDYLNKLTEYDELTKLSEITESNLEYLEYQLKELDNARLDIQEEQELEEELNYLNNYSLIYDNLNCIKDSFENNNIIEKLNDILNCLQKISLFKDTYKEDLDKFTDIFYECDELKNKVSHNIDHLDFSPERLNYINERLNEIKRIKNKYKKTVSELIQFRGEIRAKIESFELMEDKILASKNNVEILYNKLKTVCHKLTKVRMNNAKKLENDIILTLKNLKLEKTLFSVKFDNYELNNIFDSKPFKLDGCDNIDFYVSFNEGESKKELSKVASGGEMSRVMLALKCRLLNILGLDTIVFDEIDTGVSGEVADSIGKKMKEISNSIQVIAITHIPIVASYADYHSFIYKKTIENETKTFVKNLNLDERIECLSKMINPYDYTKNTKELVKNMLIK